ncbi:metal ABC transporter permease [Anaerococcus sp. DFU013_CI05]|uniref:metal ABC transporter permease n=1 Tax=unclassified Anaerococcus TaxID=2614126 RepID=UPI001EE48EB4|nr:metal ABC transporter permease [Anaerococcus sp. mt242]
MIDLFKLYSFQIVVVGITLLALASSLIGTINIYKNQSLIGDALGHSTLPGIIIAFMLTYKKDPITLLFGSVISAAISYFLIDYSNKNSKVGADANMAIYLSGFFGLGLLLKSYIQANPTFANASKAGLDKYIFGQAAYLREADIFLILLAFLLCLGIMIIFYRDIKCYLFDRQFANQIGINTKFLDYLLLFLTILVIGVGIKAVGVILISSLLIIPIVTAKKISNSFLKVIGLSALFSIITSVLGSMVSTTYKGFSTGPSIIIFQGLIFVIVTIGKTLLKGADTK